jgi:general control protein GCN4
VPSATTLGARFACHSQGRPIARSHSGLSFVSSAHSQGCESPAPSCFSAYARLRLLRNSAHDHVLLNIAPAPSSGNFYLLFSPSPHLTHYIIIQTNIDHKDVLNNSVTLTTLTNLVTIPSTTQNASPLPSYPTTPSVFPSQENLTTSTALSSSFSLSTATIPSQEFNLFTTDSQPPWLPSSSSSLPAHSPRPSPLQLQDHSGPSNNPSHQDFVLFERSPSARSTPSLSNQQAFNGQNRRHSSHLSQSAASLQNQRVAAIIQSTGHSISTSSLTNRFNPAQQQQQQQFYASSAPSSSTALQQQRPTRPQVPLFSQSTGNIPQTPNMAMQGMQRNFIVNSPARSHDSQQPADMDLFDEFTPFEGGASTQNAYHSAYSSPAVPTLYDANMNLSSSSSTNIGTVSPQDLLVRDPFASAPNSTAFTNLTSPSTYNESPEYNDNFDVSPFVGNNHDLDQALAGDPWYPLFPQDDQAEQPSVSESPLLPDEELEVSEALRNTNRRRSNGTSPPSGSHSSVSGVQSRKRDKPLPPIIVEDPNDTVAMKRARNTLAARKSRQRKMQRFDELEERIAKLEAERDHWKEIALRRNGGQ